MSISIKVDRACYLSACMLFFFKRRGKLYAAYLLIALFFLFQQETGTAAIIGGIGVATILSSLWASATNFPKIPFYRHAITYRWDQAGLSLEAATGTWLHEWSDIQGYLENQSCILMPLKVGPSFLFVPKTEAEQCRSLIETAQSAGLKRLRLFP